LPSWLSPAHSFLGAGRAGGDDLRQDFQPAISPANEMFGQGHGCILHDEYWPRHYSRDPVKDVQDVTALETNCVSDLRLDRYLSCRREI